VSGSAERGGPLPGEPCRAAGLRVGLRGARLPEREGGSGEAASQGPEAAPVPAGRRLRCGAPGVRKGEKTVAGSSSGRGHISPFTPDFRGEEHARVSDQKTRRRGTSGHGLAGMVVLGWRLGLMASEVFSNLNDCGSTKLVGQSL